MPMVRMRLIGSCGDADAATNVLHGIDGIEHVEEVGDLAPMMREDSSSSERVDDSAGHACCSEVMAPNAVRGVVERIGDARGMALEFVDAF
ncbi:MAG: hypothetical protein KGN77_01745 [Xanthomonadaceae bacterium]|nr:hypothetical protein [Xanthomonadaceae bacterium]MDE1963749.1 hypothetical protein [Xanthomonadaceae bacterium]